MMLTSRSNKPNIGITLGDPSGIGAEITAKALSKPSIRSLAHYTIIGDKKSFTRHFKVKYKNCTFAPVKPISKNLTSGLYAYAFLEKSIELIKAKKIQGLVTAPVSKELISKFKPDFKGHTEFLSDAFNIKHVGMLFVAEKMKSIIVTRHIALNKVSKALTLQSIYKTIVLTHTALKTQFQIKHPKIAICGLNPHAGESGTMGTEEITTIIPAIKKAKRANIQCVGPFAADTLFVKDNSSDYDAIVAMYHDQGLIPIKTLYFHHLVNMTIGLPFVRTSPAHGTAFNIAGKNKANPSSMVEAIKLAANLSSCHR